MELTTSRADAARFGPVIVAVLQAVADNHGDPAAAIYTELFGQHPELESLFWLDRDGSVRAAMVQQAFECILDHVEGGSTARNIIIAARQHHDGYGVPADRFDAFFVAVRDAFRRLMAGAWTDDMERAWNWLLANFSAMR